MVSKGLTKGAKVRGFKLVNIKFSWQGEGYSANDCGVYMMLHMLLYCGLIFDCGLGRRDDINLYRAEIAATLVLADINQNRAEVLHKVSEFTRSKLVTNDTSTRNPLEKSTKNKRKKTPEVVVDTHKIRRVAEQVHTTPPTTTTVSKLPELRLSASASSSSRRGKGDGLGCTLDCGQAKDGSLVVSKFLRSNQALLRDLHLIRKQVADYLFLDDYNFIKWSVSLISHHI